MSSTGDALNRYLSTVRRIEEHREQSAVKELKKLYRQLMKEIGERVAESYARYADPETGAIDYAVLHRDGMDARLLEEIMRSTGIASLEESRIIEQLAKESYAKCYDGMVSAVQRAATDDALQESLQTIRAVAPEVIAEAVHNPVNGLTLADRLEKKRGEIIYGIKQSVGVGLSQGDRYDTMTRRIAETLAGADGAGGYYGKAVRIARTEAHRVREAGNSDAAAMLQEKAAPAGYQMLKRWITMKDERVRPNRRYKTKHGWKSGKPGFYNHAAMDGVEIPLDEDFKLPSGASGPAPGKMGIAGEDINCRCFLTYRMEKTARGLIASGGKAYKPYDASDKRDIAAAQEYRKISRDNSDVKKIAKASGFTEEEIRQIKRHVFYDKHKLYTGYGNFTPDYDMAVAWKRLREGRPEARDILLLRHELLEDQLEKAYNLDIAEAHKRASLQYDWVSTLRRELENAEESYGLL
uniref:Minor capsid protein n=1 Tax=Siphoviridae sp. ct0d96 TaxID=2826268 RepID=A0A8S5M460_9CAUD|nr:MAG TPA: minor capsid protein [Siphoviridae sp. ct0d96]